VFIPGPDAKESYEQEVAALELVTRKAPPEARVVRLVEAFEEGGAFYTVTTPLCRASLEHVIDNYAKHPYSLEQALMWAVELAQIVHVLHSTCRVFHGDISRGTCCWGPTTACTWRTWDWPSTTTPTA
jgi:serine/threonine protein kinase